MKGKVGEEVREMWGGVVRMKRWPGSNLKRAMAVFDEGKGCQKGCMKGCRKGKKGLESKSPPRTRIAGAEGPMMVAS